MNHVCTVCPTGATNKSGDNASGNNTSCVSDLCKINGEDKYNRYIGVCYIGNLDLNREMVLKGWAIAYRYYSLDYIKEEEIAKNNRDGIWIGKFEEPYLFRKRNK